MTNTDMSLRDAAQAVIDRWETPLWKDAPATAVFIADLRDALAKDAGHASLSANAGEPVAWQYRSLPDVGGVWFECSKERAEQRAAHPDRWEVRPLYASPPTAQAEGWIGVDAQGLREGRWYMVTHDGMATLCEDLRDAEKEAKDADMAWPHSGPHRAMQLVEASTAGFTAADMATASAQGFRDGVASISANAGEPLVRYCPGCGSVGPVDGKYRDCCPDGGRARMIPEPLANQCRDTFQIAVRELLAAPPTAQAEGWSEGDSND